MSLWVIRILSAQSLLALLALLTVGRWFFPYTTDSLIYISTAEHWAVGQGLVFSNVFVQPALPNVLPSVLEPPGYPFLIGIWTWLGIDPYTAALIAPRVGFVVLPWLFFLVFRHILSSGPALVASFVSTFMFPVLQCAAMAWTDIPFLCFSLMSLAAAFYIVERKGKAHPAFLVLAGMLAGYSFLIRYVGLSLIIGIGAGFIACRLIKIIRRRDFVRLLLLYGVGMVLVIVPFLFRNWIVFGSIQPYHMPSSQVSVGWNVSAYLRSLGLGIFASEAFAGPVLLILVGAFVGLVAWSRRLIRRSPLFFVFIFILLSYLTAYATLLIVYKSIFQAPEEINTRYLIQAAWIVMGMLVFGACSGFRRLRRFKLADIPPLVGIMLMAFVLIQSFPAIDAWQTQQKVHAISAKVKNYVPALRSLPSDYVIVSNVADIVYFHTRRNVRMLDNYTPFGLVHALRGQRFAVFIVKGDEFSSPAWQYLRLWDKPAGYKPVHEDQDVSIFVPFE